MLLPCYRPGSKVDFLTLAILRQRFVEGLRNLNAPGKPVEWRALSNLSIALRASRRINVAII